MLFNTETTVTVGATGTVIPFTFYGPRNVGPFDADGKVDLSDYTITATTKQNGEVFIDAAACVADANQVTNKSQGTLTLDEPAAAHPAGEYRLKFKVEDGSGNVWFFPTHKDGVSCLLTMVDP